MCGEIMNCCLKWLNSSYGCLLWLFLVWWFIELIGCDVDVLASFPLILFSSSYRPRWVLGPLWGLGRVELYIVTHSKSVWRVQLDGITRYVRSAQKFWTETKFLTHQKVLRAVSLCLKPIGMTDLKPKIKNTELRVWIRLSVLRWVHVLRLPCA
jgi:hypothetical protein